MIVIVVNGAFYPSFYIQMVVPTLDTGMMFSGSASEVDDDQSWIDAVPLRHQEPNRLDEGIEERKNE